MLDRKYATSPIFFDRNRVFRVYKGGKLFHDFFGDEDRDGNKPEEWMASTTMALNRVPETDHDGLSMVEGTGVSLKQLFEDYPMETLGGGKFDILVKMLDSAIRLPIQAHPDKAFSRKYFKSEYGKTECWLIIATRPDAKLYFGFKNEMTREQFSEYVDKCREDKDCMTDILHEIEPKVGEVYLIPALCVHAIGYGCLILECQEPTDFTVQPEWWCGDYLLNEYEMYLGLDKATALECFSYDVHGVEAESLSRREPKPMIDNADYKKENLINAQDTPCFVENRDYIHGTMPLTDAPALYIVVEGKGSLDGDGYHRDITKGDYFVLPYIARDKYSITSQDMTVVECMPAKR